MDQRYQYRGRHRRDELHRNRRIHTYYFIAIMILILFIFSYLIISIMRYDAIRNTNGTMPYLRSVKYIDDIDMLLD